MGVTITNSVLKGEPEGILISLSGAATIGEAGEIRAALTAALSTHAAVIVDVSGVCAVDAAILQLLHSAQITAGQGGKGFGLQGESSGAFGEAARSAGFVSETDTGSSLLTVL